MPPIRALVIVAHPDDAESHAGGTVAKLARAGTRIAYCISTNGEKGSDDGTMTPERLATIEAEGDEGLAEVLESLTALEPLVTAPKFMPALMPIVPWTARPARAAEPSSGG